MKDLQEVGDNRAFNLEEFLFNNRKPFLFLLIGLILLGVGIFWQKEKTTENKIEIIESQENNQTEFLVAEISGAVERPGVYKLNQGARVEDIIIASGGISAAADRNWLEKYLNRAAKLTDGQKIYIPSLEGLAPQQDQPSTVAGAKNVVGYQTISSDFSSQKEGLININTASQKELESLWGIGPVYAQKIIEQRPYSNVEELISRKVIKQNTYEKIKDQITVY